MLKKKQNGFSIIVRKSYKIMSKYQNLLNDKHHIETKEYQNEKQQKRLHAVQDTLDTLQKELNIKHQKIDENELKKYMEQTALAHALDKHSTSYTVASGTDAL